MSDAGGEPQGLSCIAYDPRGVRCDACAAGVPDGCTMRVAVAGGEPPARLSYTLDRVGEEVAVRDAAYARLAGGEPPAGCVHCGEEIEGALHATGPNRSLMRCAGSVYGYIAHTESPCESPCLGAASVAGGEPPEWSDPSDLTRISLAAAGREFGAGGESTRPSEQEWLAAATSATVRASEVGWLDRRAKDASALSFLVPLIERERADAAAHVVAAVEALHQKSVNLMWRPTQGTTAVTSHRQPVEVHEVDCCDPCRTYWPCPTVRAARGATGGGT